MIPKKSQKTKGDQITSVGPVVYGWSVSIYIGTYIMVV